MFIQHRHLCKSTKRAYSRNQWSSQHITVFFFFSCVNAIHIYKIQFGCESCVYWSHHVCSEVFECACIYMQSGVSCLHIYSCMLFLQTTIVLLHIDPVKNTTFHLLASLLFQHSGSHVFIFEKFQFFFISEIFFFSLWKSVWSVHYVFLLSGK